MSALWVQRLGPPPAVQATAAVLTTTRARAWVGCCHAGQMGRTSALENEGRGMGRGGEGSAAPARVVGRRAAGLPSGLTGGDETRAELTARADAAGSSYSVGLSFMR
jgi:hypothetical protein